MALPPRPRALVPLFAALVAPPLVCLALVPVRSHVENTNAALLLVLVVVTVASFGDRPSGVLAALSAGLAFDFFLTAPYESFTIAHNQDIETGVLLLLVGMAVTEIALWGRRQHAHAGETSGYLAGLQRSTPRATRASRAKTRSVSSTKTTSAMSADHYRFSHTAMLARSQRAKNLC